jgi:hypothetical protein
MNSEDDVWCVNPETVGPFSLDDVNALRFTVPVSKLLNKEPAIEWTVSAYQPDAVGVTTK